MPGEDTGENMSNCCQDDPNCKSGKMEQEELLSALYGGGDKVKEQKEFKFWDSQPVPKMSESLTLLKLQDLFVIRSKIY